MRKGYDIVSTDEEIRCLRIDRPAEQTKLDEMHKRSADLLNEGAEFHIV
jgi:hypothetical protein